MSNTFTQVTTEAIKNLTGRLAELQTRVIALEVVQKAAATSGQTAGDVQAEPAKVEHPDGYVVRHNDGWLDGTRHGNQSFNRDRDVWEYENNAKRHAFNFGGSTVEPYMPGVTPDFIDPSPATPAIDAELPETGFIVRKPTGYMVGTEDGNRPLPSTHVYPSVDAAEKNQVSGEWIEPFVRGVNLPVIPTNIAEVVRYRGEAADLRSRLAKANKDIGDLLSRHRDEAMRTREQLAAKDRTIADLTTQLAEAQAKVGRECWVLRSKLAGHLWGNLSTGEVAVWTDRKAAEALSSSRSTVETFYIAEPERPVIGYWVVSRDGREVDRSWSTIKGPFSCYRKELMNGDYQLIEIHAGRIVPIDEIEAVATAGKVVAK